MLVRKNCGTTDRIARVVIAALIGAGYLLGYLKGTLAIVLGVSGVVLLVTSAAGYCPLYEPLGMDTRKEKD
jgi:hypothetical protein